MPARVMLVDMHCHSVSSDDARATVEQYLRWVQVLRKQGYRIDAIVLTEHRKFDAERDYTSLGHQYGVLVLKGSELDTRYGHFLVYGVNERLRRAFDFTDVTLDAVALVREAEASGAIAIPAHPGRTGIGFCEYVHTGPDFRGVRVVELLNGGDRPGENERAQALVRARGLLGTGGSDAHFVSAVGGCLTEFSRPIRNEQELVEALHRGGFRALRLEETKT
ncbi:MAG: PHP domain-containing protein, partial [Chloroflexi bacterium]|nr:PHP domain-containing protein [Chloroflexota bacterium]